MRRVWLLLIALFSSVAIAQTAQTISFPQVATSITATLPIMVTLSATSTSELPITYTFSGVSGHLYAPYLTITGSGTLSITASQSGSASYSAAAPVTQTIAINPGTAPAQTAQTITFGAIANSAYGSGPLTLTASSSSGLAVLYAVTGPASLSGSTLTATGVGTVAVTASQPGNASYSAATSVTQSFSVTPGSQSITFPAVSTQTYPGPAVTLAASASSGLPVSYSATGPATVNGSTLTLTGVGTVAVTASQAGGANYAAALAVSQNVTVYAPGTLHTITITGAKITLGGNITIH